MSTNGDPDYVHAQTGKVLGAFLTQQPLEELVGPAREEVLTSAMGAAVTFDGIVRDHDGGQRVKLLTYSSHPSADAEIARIAGEVAAAHPAVRLWTAHRTGPLTIGELAFVVIAASAHRKDSFVAAADLADRVKAEVPIWKEQLLDDDSVQWVGIE
ncbi:MULTISPECIES: molybdenum cofactor biosynthesis protein MoaE [unclassified Corynebacterium]